MRGKIADNGKVLIELDQDEARTLMQLVQNPPPWASPDEPLCRDLFNTLQPLWPRYVQPLEDTFDGVPF